MTLARVSHAQTLPSTPRVATVDTLSGIIVPDPYRWLEDMQAPATRDWVRQEDAYTRLLMNRIPSRVALHDSIVRIAAAPTYSAPVKEGSRYFYTVFPATGPSRSSNLVVRDSATAREDTLIGAAGGDAAHQYRRAVPDPLGQVVAYGVSQGASEWETVHVRDVVTKHDGADAVTGVHRYSGLAWARRGPRGFYYTRFHRPADTTDLATAVDGGVIYFHRLGTSQDSDRMIYRRPDHPNWVLRPTVSDDGRFLIITGTRGADRNNRLFIQDLLRRDAPVQLLTGDGDAFYAYVGSDGLAIWVQSDLDAPRGRIVGIDADRPARPNWIDLVPQSQDAIDAWIGAKGIGGRLVVAYRHDALLAVTVFDHRGHRLYDVQLPSLGSVWTGFAGKATSNEALYTLQGVADPGTIYRMDITTGRSTPFLKPHLPYDPSAFITEQVTLESRDGTRIPMYLVHRPDLPRDGTAPGWIYGYGALSWTAAPWFQPVIAQWLLSGGVWAVPNIRGGGEYGERWHEAGIRRNKQNGIDDYVAAGQWLIDHGYVARGRLVAHGSSAGGALVAAALVQQPTLFAAGILEYPAIDVVRYDRFSAGHNWQSEYGVASDPDDLRAMLRYAALQNVRPGICYPATFVAPGERDETAAPMHAYKFVATLQASQPCAHPIVLRESWGAGHTAGATLPDAVDNWTDQLLFARDAIAVK